VGVQPGAEPEPAAEDKQPAAEDQQSAPEADLQKVTQGIPPEEPGKQVEAPKGKPILAEKFAAESSINENLAGQRKGGNEPRLVGQPIDSIHRNIGINDRFLIIRELFAGDADSFRELLQQLDDAGDYQKANDLLKERFPAAKEHEGIEILAGLIKRRFSTV